MRLYLAAGTEGAAAAGLRASLLLVCAAIEDAEADDSAEPARNDFPEPKVDEMHQARMCAERDGARARRRADFARARATAQGGTPALPPRAGAPAKTRGEGEAGKEGVRNPKL